MGLKILHPGLLSLIQDTGRVGFYRHGITLGGPADKLSYLWANRLCGNRAHTPAMEITLGGLEVEATGPLQMAVTGADVELSINGNPMHLWRSYNLAAGDRIRLGACRGGVRNYLAVRGGFKVPLIFNSAATVVRENLGGLDGKPLKQGSVVEAESSESERMFAMPDESRPRFKGEPITLRTVPGWHARDLPRALKQDFFSRRFAVSSHSNRMGVRLQGAPLPGLDQVPRALVSEGIVPGTIQLPPEGGPIVMLCDHQTIGGYPKLGTVITVDQWRLAQARPGQTVTFSPVTAARAAALLRLAEREFERCVPIPV